MHTLAGSLKDGHGKPRVHRSKGRLTRVGRCKAAGTGGRLFGVVGRRTNCVAYKGRGKAGGAVVAKAMWWDGVEGVEGVDGVDRLGHRGGVLAL